MSFDDVKDLIEVLENKIGNGARVSFSVELETLVIFVIWYKDNISAKYAVPQTVDGLELNTDEFIEYVSGWFIWRRKYAVNNKESIK